MEDSTTAGLLNLHQYRNQQSAKMYDDFSQHRQMISGLLNQCLSMVRPGFEGMQPKLTVWGAGNTNDLDLPAICQRFEMVQLADLDQTALDNAMQRSDLSASDRAKIRLAGGWDVTGLFDQLAALAQSSDQDRAKLTDDFIAGALNSPPQPAANSTTTSTSIADTDIVISSCILSQLIDSVYKILGDDFPRVNDVVLAMRDNHLQMLLNTVLNGSVAVLATDFVSSDTLEALKTEMPPKEFNEMVISALNQHNFFTGTNPAAIGQRLQGLYQQLGPERVSRPLKVGLTQPWCWKFGSRAFAAIAIILSLGE